METGKKSCFLSLWDTVDSDRTTATEIMCTEFFLEMWSFNSMVKIYIPRYDYFIG